MTTLTPEMLATDEARIAPEDLQAWAQSVSAAAPAEEGANPGDAFFSSAELRDTYSVPWNEHICLVDLAAFPAGPVPGLRYGKATPLVPLDGNVYQFLLSEDGKKLALVSAFTLDALKTGALTPEDLAGPAPAAVATGIIVGAAKCAGNAACRAAAVKAGKFVAGAIAGGALWDGIKKVF